MKSTKFDKAEVEAAERSLYYSLKAEEAVCELYGTNRFLLYDDKTAECIRTVYGVDLLFDVFDERGDKYATERIIEKATSSGCEEEEEAWYNAAVEVLKDLGILPESILNTIRDKEVVGL